MSEEIGPQVPIQLRSRIWKVDNESKKTSHDTDPHSSIDEAKSKTKEYESTSIGLAVPQQDTKVSLQQEVKNLEDEEVDLDAYLPALPPDLLAERQKKKLSQRKHNTDLQGTTNAKKQKIGPTMLPPSNSYRYQKLDQEEDVIGPVLPKDFHENNDEYLVQQTIHDFEERAEKMSQTLKHENDTKPLERGEWMLVPPEAVFLGETPTNMRSRKFKQKAYDPKNSNNSLWTEVPVDGHQQNVTTDQKRKQEGYDETDPVEYTLADLENSERIKAYNELYRPKSLFESHSESYAKSRKWKDDDVSKRPFDREKDLLGTRRMDSRKRKEIFDSSKDLGSKFGHGRSGAFL